MRRAASLLAAVDCTAPVTAAGTLTGAPVCLCSYLCVSALHFSCTDIQDTCADIQGSFVDIQSSSAEILHRFVGGAMFLKNIYTSNQNKAYQRSV